jgi:hypothetical protein
VADHGSHGRHDRFAIADAIGSGAAPASLRTCPACGTLHADLVRLQIAVRDAWTPRRPRDLNLTTEDARRLRRTGWRRLVAVIGTGRDTITRPLALSFTGLGLAGLLLTAIPATFPMATGAAPAEDARTMSAGAPAASAPPGAPGWEVPGDSGASNPAPVVLPGLSMGLLLIGGAIFAVRRVASRMEAVR